MAWQQGLAAWRNLLLRDGPHSLPGLQALLLSSPSVQPGFSPTSSPEEFWPIQPPLRVQASFHPHLIQAPHFLLCHFRTQVSLGSPACPSYLYVGISRAPYTLTLGPSLLPALPQAPPKLNGYQYPAIQVRCLHSMSPPSTPSIPHWGLLWLIAPPTHIFWNHLFTRV